MRGGAVWISDGIFNRGVYSIAELGSNTKEGELTEMGRAHDTRQELLQK